MTNNSEERRPVWVGLAHVAPFTGCEVLAQGKNAFTNVVGRATTASEFESEVSKFFRLLDLDLLALSEVAFYAERFKEMTIPAEIEAARAELAGDQSVAFGTFFTYSVD